MDTHPLRSQVEPFCRKYPAQSPALFQTFVDLSLVQAWADVKLVDLGNSVAVRGVPKNKTAVAFTYPMMLNVALSLCDFADVFDQLDQLGENGRVSEIFLAMVDADSSVVYYVLKRGVVSPKEVRE